MLAADTVAASSTLLKSLPQVITAIGGLGTAAFGLLDALKSVMPWINHIGFGRIKTLVSELTPPETVAATEGTSATTRPPANSLPQAGVVSTLEANWINGADLASQKTIAKSLIKLHLSAGNADALADRTNVDAALLKGVAANIVTGTPLTQLQSDAFSRFDMIVTALLDEAYQHSDQVYRNWTRVLAGAIAVTLSVVAGATLYVPPTVSAGAQAAGYFNSASMWQAVLVGLLATPLAPIAKDLSSALSTAVNTLQAVKK